MSNPTMLGLESSSPVDNEQKGDIHIVLKSEFPIALCGYKVKSAWDSKLETAGRDRCYGCFSIAHRKYGGFKG